MEKISVLDILKIGIGPSSSHTMGPWTAATRFLEALNVSIYAKRTHKVTIHLYGSLALTGKGHATVEALILGLSGYDFKQIPMDLVRSIPAQTAETGQLNLGQAKVINFSVDQDIIFHFDKRLAFHTNGLVFYAFDELGNLLLEDTFYSVGGGFVVRGANEKEQSSEVTLPYPITYAKDLKAHCQKTNKDIAWIIQQNEQVWLASETFDVKVLQIWDVMLASLFKGCYTEGVLPGGLAVARRAPDLLRSIIGNQTFANKEEWLAFLKNLDLDFEATLKLVSCLAIATNEENADFGRVVTAPTNGAAGVIPAVLMYLICRKGAAIIGHTDIINFLCVAAEIGSIFKKKSTISAAMGGCQAEIGVSASMAAAALTYSLKGSVDQVLMAAEIAMEHHLGLTCDPVGGLVQIPCIERNSMGAIKAITASQIALGSDPSKAKISLDAVIKTMWETAQDMNQKYKETSLGGLATNYAVSIAEC